MAKMKEDVRESMERLTEALLDGEVGPLSTVDVDFDDLLALVRWAESKTKPVGLRVGDRVEVTCDVVWTQEKWLCKGAVGTVYQTFNPNSNDVRVVLDGDPRIGGEASPRYFTLYELKRVL